MEELTHKDYQVSGVMVFVTLLFGINPIVVKLGINAMQPILFTTSRFFVAVVTFTLVLVITKQWVRPQKEDIRDFVIIGVEAFIFQIGMITALRYVSAAIVATMLGLTPVSILCIHRFRGFNKIFRHHYLGALITFSGVLFISGMFEEALLVSLGPGVFGIGILLLAQFSSACYIIRSEKLLKTYSHYQVTALMFLGTFLLFLFLSIPVVMTEGILPVSHKAGFCIIYGGVISLCLANTLWVWGVKKIGSHQTSIFNNLPPVFALLTGMLFLNEFPMPSQVLGVVLVLVGLYVFNHRPRQVA